MNTLIARARTILGAPSLSSLANDSAVMDRARTVIFLYYLILPIVAFQFLRQWGLASDQILHPFFPLAWSYGLDSTITINIIRFGFLAAALAGLAYYRSRIVRIAVFVGVWQAHALASAHGIEVNHQLYTWMYTSCLFIFLPKHTWTADAPAETQRTLLLYIWWAQAMVLLAYTLAGFWKIVVAFQQMAAGQIHGFSPDAFAYQIANWIPQLQNQAPLAWIILDHPILGWPLYLGVQYMQLFALWAMVRPSLQKLWAFELVLFHIGTYLFMGIEFDPFLFLLFALFFASPFAPTVFSWRTVLHDMPIIGQLLALVERYAIRHAKS